MFNLSVVSVILSSYFILSGFNVNREKTKNAATGLLYFLLIAFAQIVLSFETLSLFKAISQNGFLICNSIFLLISILVFYIKSKKLYLPEDEIKKIIFALKRDKALKFLSVCFIFFCIFQLIRIFCFPVVFGDSLAYYLPRCTAWIQFGSISHFITPDTRELVMPVNMEFLYTWVLLFLKSERGIAIFSFIGFIGAVYVIYNLLKELKFRTRQCLWAVFIFSSFALVIMEMVNPCADLFIGTLILASIYLYIKSVKSEDKTALYFSSLAYALAVGTKTTAIIAIPSVFLIYCAINYIYKKKIINKHLAAFCGLFILNFLIFASYNYILNTIQFLNPLSSQEQIIINKFKGGIKGYTANVIKYLFVIFDMSGLPKFIKVNGIVEYWQSLVLSLLGTNIKAGTSTFFPGHFEFGNKMGMMHSALGLTGLFAFLPSFIYSIKRSIKNKKSKTALIILVLAVSIIFNIFLFSGIMVFTSYNMRYLLTFAIIASPVIVYSYPFGRHKFWKIFLCIIMFMYFIGFAHHKPVSYIIECIKQQKTVQRTTEDEENNVYEYFIKKAPVNIAIMNDQTKAPVYFMEKLRFYGFYIDKILAENLEVYDLTNFDYIITNKETTVSTNTVIYKERKKNKNLYAADCTYVVDKKGHPYMVECLIPFGYFKEKGFIPDENYKGEKYIILKNINSKSHTNE